MNPIDALPSTYDLPPIRGGQDPILAILIGARKRYKRGGTAAQYIAPGGAVCAIGAVVREAGLTAKLYDASEGELSSLKEIAWTMEHAKIEKETINTTKKAIKLLNRTALKLYPDSKRYKGSMWSGPLEWINQTYGEYNLTEAKKLVLAVYDKTIEKRQTQLA